MSEERSDERGVGMGGGYPHVPHEFFLEDILEMAQFGGTLILIYRCKTGPGQHQETQSGLQEAMSKLEKYSKSMLTPQVTGFSPAP